MSPTVYRGDNGILPVVRTGNKLSAINYKYPDIFHETNGFLKSRHLIPSTNNSNDADTHHKATCCTLTLPNPLQTVPQAAAHPMRHSFKINGITSIDMKCEKI
jgi:hypothetical protein